MGIPSENDSGAAPGRLEGLRAQRRRSLQELANLEEKIARLASAGQLEIVDHSALAQQTVLGTPVAQ